MGKTATVVNLEAKRGNGRKTAPKAKPQSKAEAMEIPETAAMERETIKRAGRDVYSLENADIYDSGEGRLSPEQRVTLNRGRIADLVDATEILNRNGGEIAPHLEDEEVFLKKVAEGFQNLRCPICGKKAEFVLPLKFVLLQQKGWDWSHREFNRALGLWEKIVLGAHSARRSNEPEDLAVSFEGVVFCGKCKPIVEEGLRAKRPDIVEEHRNNGHLHNVSGFAESIGEKYLEFLDLFLRRSNSVLDWVEKTLSYAEDQIEKAQIAIEREEARKKEEERRKQGVASHLNF